MRAVRNEKFECVAVTVGAKAADHCLRHVAEIGMLPEGLAGMWIRQMYFHERDAHCCECVTQGDARMGEGGRIDQNEAGAVGTGSLYAIDQLVLGVGLEMLKFMACLCRALDQAAIDLLKRGAVINARLVFAEQV